MDWSSAIGGLLRCAPDTQYVHGIIVILGGLASLTTITIGIYRVWRWWRGPQPKHQQAARALRKQGWFRHRLRHRAAAMELYTFSIRLNPRAGHVYYLRGCLYAELGDERNAMADWRWCIARLPRHRQALKELAKRGLEPQPLLAGWAYVAGATAVVIVALFLGALAR